LLLAAQVLMACLLLAVQISVPTLRNKTKEEMMTAQDCVELLTGGCKAGWTLRHSWRRLRQVSTMINGVKSGSRERGWLARRKLFVEGADFSTSVRSKASEEAFNNPVCMQGRVVPGPVHKFQKCWCKGSQVQKGWCKGGHKFGQGKCPKSGSRIHDHKVADAQWR
jgi:hypothetical protein